MLHVDLFGLVARERDFQRVQFAALQGLLPLGLIQEIGIEMLGAEEQPVAALGAGFGALLHKAAERRHAGAGPIIRMSRSVSAGSRKRAFGSM